MQVEGWGEKTGRVPQAEASEAARRAEARGVKSIPGALSGVPTHGSVPMSDRT